MDMRLVSVDAVLIFNCHYFVSRFLSDSSFLTEHLRCLVLRVLRYRYAQALFC